TGSLRDQTLAVLENIDAQRKRADSRVELFDAELAMKKSTKNLTESLKENGNAWKGNSDAALENQSRVSDWISTYNDLALKLPVGSKKLDRLYNKFVNLMTPILGSKKAARQFANEVLKLPQDVVTQVRLLGKDASAKQIADLLYQYDLTPDEVRTILDSTDLSTKKINAVLRRLNNLDKQNADPSITAKDRATAKFHEARR